MSIWVKFRWKSADGVFQLGWATCCVEGNRGRGILQYGRQTCQVQMKNSGVWNHLDKMCSPVANWCQGRCLSVGWCAEIYFRTLAGLGFNEGKWNSVLLIQSLNPLSVSPKQENFGSFWSSILPGYVSTDEMAIRVNFTKVSGWGSSPGWANYCVKENCGRGTIQYGGKHVKRKEKS